MGKIKGFKGMDKNMKCRDFQYELDKEYVTDKKPVRCTENGFHLCENPLDIFAYYAAGESRFFEVEGDGEISLDKEDSKVAVSKIKIGIELSLHDLIMKGIKFIFEKTTLTKESTNTIKGLQSSNSGYSGAASNSGYRGAASNSGYSGAASNSGDRGAASNSGYRGAASNSGDRGAAMATGNYSTAETSGKESIACGLGFENKVKGSLGSWIVLAERDNECKIKSVKTIKVDGKKIKENVFYKLKNGKFIKAE